MKVKLIKNLKSRVLLVDGLPEGAENIFYNETVEKETLLMYKVGVDTFYYKGIQSNNWKLIGLLKDITDSDCEGLVDSENNTSSCNCEYCGFDFIAYRDYKNQTNEDFKKHSSADCLSTAKESFLSALESENVLFENPHEEPKICCSNPDCGCFGIPYNYSSQEELDDFLEAEQNVFSPETLIFVEL